MKSITKFTLADVALESDAIPTNWLLSGAPETRKKLLVRTHDFLAQILIWECGAVTYKWHYTSDEAYIVISGEGFMTDEKGMEHHFGPGDVAFFPAGTNATWRHPDHFKKVAFLKESFGRPVGFCLKACGKLLRLLGLTAGPQFLLALMMLISLKRG